MTLHVEKVNLVTSWIPKPILPPFQERRRFAISRDLEVSGITVPFGEPLQRACLQVEKTMVFPSGDKTGQKSATPDGDHWRGFEPSTPTITILDLRSFAGPVGVRDSLSVQKRPDWFLLRSLRSLGGLRFPCLQGPYRERRSCLLRKSRQSACRRGIRQARWKSPGGLPEHVAARSKKRRHELHRDPLRIVVTIRILSRTQLSRMQRPTETRRTEKLTPASGIVGSSTARAPVTSTR